MNGTLNSSIFFIYTVLTLTSDLFHQLISNLKNFVPQVRLTDIFAGRLIEVYQELERGFFANIYVFDTFERFLPPYCMVISGRERGDHIYSPRSCIWSF